MSINLGDFVKLRKPGKHENIQHSNRIGKLVFIYPNSCMEGNCDIEFPDGTKTTVPVWLVTKPTLFDRIFRMPWRDNK